MNELLLGNEMENIKNNKLLAPKLIDDLAGKK
jgi:hypothetical protein